ncbi:MAG: TCR/Tet family MFS transporter, partial [Proteobacteria bacterium]|nr:TCR/Tet family MFS transporter [Pseudomonadota bacterium]
MTEPKTFAAPRRAALAFIFVTVLLDMLAIGLIIPVLPKLVVVFQAGDVASAAEIFGLFGTAWALMQFVFAPVQGALSDRFGRRPVILLSNLGLGLDYIVMALAPNLTWLFVGRVISGITAASISTSFAYIADVTSPDKRAAGFGLVGTAFGVGFVIGPALGGLLGSLDLRLPFWVAAGLSLANFLYGVLILPESLPAGNRAGWSWRRANPIGSLVLLRSYPRLLGLSSVNFLQNLAHVVLPAVFVLYAGHRYDWDERAVGLTLAGVGVCSAVVQGGLVRPLVARFGERRTMLLGLGCGAAGFAIYGLAPTGALFAIGVPVMALWGLTGPSVQALMSQRVSPSEQGQLQGAQSSLQGVAGLIGPGLFTLTFAYAIAPAHPWELPGAPFLLAAVMLLAGALVGAR